MAGTPEPEPSGSRVASGPPVPLNVGWHPTSARGPDQATRSFLSRSARPRHTVCAHCPSAPLLCSPPTASQVGHPLGQGKDCALTPGRETLPHRQKPKQIWFRTVLWSDSEARGDDRAGGHRAGVWAGPARLPRHPAFTASWPVAALWSARHHRGGQTRPCAPDATSQAAVCPQGPLPTQEAKRPPAAKPWPAPPPTHVLALRPVAQPTATPGRSPAPRPTPGCAHSRLRLSRSWDGGIGVRGTHGGICRPPERPRTTAKTTWISSPGLRSCHATSSLSWSPASGRLPVQGWGQSGTPGAWASRVSDAHRGAPCPAPRPVPRQPCPPDSRAQATRATQEDLRPPGETVLMQLRADTGVALQPVTRDNLEVGGPRPHLCPGAQAHRGTDVRAPPGRDHSTALTCWALSSSPQCLGECSPTLGLAEPQSH